MTKRAARKPATRRAAAPKKRPQQRRKPQPGMLDKAVAALPFSEATLRRIAAWGIVGLFGAAALGVASWFGLPAMAGVATANAIGEAGFRVEKIDITGLRRMDEMTVYSQALDQNSRAMPLVDLEGVRERLLKYPWIEDARVSRRLPNTLSIHIVERIPAAIWQSHGRLMLVDTKGVPLEPVSREAMPDLPLLIGDGANAQEEARRRLMDAAPRLKPLVKAATWIGNRRWDLVFDTGERLLLPEGEREAADALVEFAEMDRTQRLLGKNYQRFDMRVEGRMVMRKQGAAVPDAADAAAAAAAAEPVSNQGQE
ncbi:MAG: cell division protein FtsQ/DivIB [Pseudomonadota bacterium]